MDFYLKTSTRSFPWSEVIISYDGVQVLTCIELVSIVFKFLAGKSSFIEELQDQEIQKGSPVTLTAKISSTGTEPKITWKKDTQVLGRGRARMTYDKGTLTLKYARTDYEDAGVYTVEVDTGSGVVKSSAKLEIAGMCVHLLL